MAESAAPADLTPISPRRPAGRNLGWAGTVGPKGSTVQTVVELDRSGDRLLLTWRRRYAHPTAEVWAAVTEPEQADVWWGMPLRLELEPEVGGTIRFHWRAGGVLDEGTVLAIDDGHLGFTWDTEEQHWRVQPDGDATLVELTFTESDEGHVANQAAAWFDALERLDAHLRGEAVAEPRDDPAEPGRVAQMRLALGLPGA
jgi:uncharacterized protein YndB with AHSA1/START domain